MKEEPMYNKTNPYLAAIVDRYPLCQSGSLKNTCHLALDLKGSGITYQVGDSLAVMAVNIPEVVQKTIEAAKADGTEIVHDKHTGAAWTLLDYFSQKVNLAAVPRKLVSEICQRQTSLEKKAHLLSLFEEEHKDALKEYMSSHEVWDVLAENQEVSFAPEELCKLLMPMLPRFYSIASSMAAVGDEVHLTVAELSYTTNGHLRRGVCTHYLCQLAPMHENSVPIYIQPSHGFTLPPDPHAPMIMVGPGTGVAPFRAFMQERAALGAPGLNWLFFGERHRASEFFYEDDWQRFVDAGKLRLDTAFSRDQEHKIYVQHRLLEHGADIYSLLEQGAYFYVCGDAHRMAKDVDTALHQIIEQHGSHSEQAAKEYVKALRSEKRYLRDVY